MAIVQTTGKLSFSGAGNKTFNTGTPFTAGTSVHVTIEFFASGSTDIASMTAAGSAMTEVIGQQFHGTATQSAIWWVASNAGGSDAVVVNFGAGNHDGFISIIERNDVTGLATGAIENDVNQGASLAPTVPTLGPTTSTPVFVLAVSASGSVASPNTYTQPGGWTALGNETNGSTNNSGASAYLNDAGATGVKTATWAQTDSSISNNCIAVWTVSAGGGGGGAGSRNRLLVGAG
jgi:hypothetical protein